MSRSSFGVVSSRPNIGDADATPAKGPRITGERPKVRAPRKAKPSKRTARSRAYKRKKLEAGRIADAPQTAPKARKAATPKAAKPKPVKAPVRAARAAAIASQHQAPIYDPKTSIAALSTAWEGN